MKHIVINVKHNEVVAEYQSQSAASAKCYRLNQSVGHEGYKVIEVQA